MLTIYNTDDNSFQTVEENLVAFVLAPDGKYSGGKMYSGGDRLTAAAVPGFLINVSEIFEK